MIEIVKDHYNKNALVEWGRLSDLYSNIEFQTTLYMIGKYFKKSGNVLDIGCGPGRYSIELLKKGYNVTLYDISQEELNVAREKIEQEKMKADDYICGDCSDLSIFEDNSFDVVLVMGPMYHVQDNKLRKYILKNTKRILKEDGMALIAYLNGFGIIKSSLHECSFEYANIENIEKLMLDKSWSKEEAFTEVYISNPSGAIKEIEDSDLNIVTYFGSESFASGIHHEVRRMGNEESNCYKNLIELCKKTCEMKEYRDSTEHTHFIVKK